MERRNLYGFPQSPMYLWTEFISKSISTQEMGATVAGECWDDSRLLWQQHLTALWKKGVQGKAVVMPRGIKPRGADADSQDWERPVRERTTGGSVSWCRALSHGSASPRGPGKLTRVPEWVWNRRPKKRICAFWSLKGLLEAYVSYHLRAGGLVWELVIWS